MNMKSIFKTKQEKKPVNRRQLKNGSYSMLVTALAVAGAVAVNLIVSELPSQYTKIDVTSQQLSTLTEQSKEIVESLDEDVTIYYILQDSNRDTYVSRLLERYEDLSSHITVVEKDPVLYPNFTSQYTDDSLTENSVIVECGDSSRVISYDDMYEYELNYYYYSYETTGFDAEGQITSAIAAVTSDDLPKLYVLTGHNELSLDDSLTQSIEKENIETEELNLVTAEAVPEDADCLLIISPQTDFSDAETQKILSYMMTGGKVLLLTDYTGTDMPNLGSILEYYGVALVDGVVIEGNSNYYVQVPYYLVPDINSSEVSSDMTGGSSYVLLAAAQGIETLEDARDTLTIDSVLSSSGASYSKADVENMSTYEKESGDTDGPFDLGVIITETVELTDELVSEAEGLLEAAGISGTLDKSLSLSGIDGDTDDEMDETEEESEAEEAADINETEEAASAGTEADGADAEAEEEDAETAETKLAVFTSSALLDSSANQMVSGGNYELFINTVSWMCGHTSTVSVPVKSMSVSYLTLTSASSSFWSIIVIVIIPGIFLISGLIIWLRRRKK